MSPPIPNRSNWPLQFDNERQCEALLERVSLQPTRADLPFLGSLAALARLGMHPQVSSVSSALKNSLLALECCGKLTALLIASLVDDASNSTYGAMSLYQIEHVVSDMVKGLESDLPIVRVTAYKSLQKFAGAGDSVVGAKGKWPGSELEALAKLASGCS
jgi:hypothetical protein